MKEKLGIFLDKQKQREIVTSCSVLPEELKEVFQGKLKGHYIVIQICKK